MAEVKVKPQVPVTKLSIGDRALGDVVKLDVALTQTTTEDGQANVDLTEVQQEDLAGDVFWNMFKSKPELRDDVPQSRKANKAIVDWMRDFQGYKDCVDTSRHSIPVAKASTQVIFKRLLNSQDVKDALSEQWQSEAHEKLAQKKRAEAAAARATGDDAKAFRLEQRAEVAKKRAQDHSDASVEAIEKAKGDTTSQARVRAALTEAKKEADTVNQVLTGFGIGKNGTVHRNAVEAAELEEVMFQNKEFIEDVAEIAGRVRGAALSAARNAVQTGTPKNMTRRTRRVDKLVPAERAYISETSPIKAFKIAELVQSGLRGRVAIRNGEKAGPFIAMVDVSPSTWSAAYNHSGISRHVLLTGISWGLAQYAKEEGREYAMVAFGSDESSMEVVTSGDGWQRHMSVLTSKQSGGTDFNMALMKAMELFRTFENKTTVDVVFLSDGEGHVSDATEQIWNEFAKQETSGARLWFVPCTSRPSGTDVYNLWDVADEVLEIEQITKKAGIGAAQKVGARMRR